MAHNSYIKTKCSQQIQIVHSKFKSLTANSNRSQQITNRSQQIQIAHSKFKSLTANSRVCLFVEGRGYVFECRGSLFYTEKWARLQNTHTTYIELQNVATAVPQSGYNLFTIRNSYSVFIYFVTESQYLKQMTRPPQSHSQFIIYAQSVQIHTSFNSVFQSFIYFVAKSPYLTQMCQ